MGVQGSLILRGGCLFGGIGFAEWIGVNEGYDFHSLAEALQKKKKKYFLFKEELGFGDKGIHEGQTISSARIPLAT